MSAADTIAEELEAAPAGAASLCDQAYTVLKQRIITNRLPAGSYVDEREIALELGMSRTPVREALIRLQSEGFVVMEPRRGVRVVPISPEVMQEVYDVLTGLESMAAALLAGRRPSAAELAPMRATLDEMAAALADDDVERWLHADERFHRVLLTLCGNARLTEAGLRFRDQIARAHLVVSRMHPGPGRSTAAHEELYAALLAGDAEAARNNHYHQRVRAGHALMDTLKRVGLTNL